MKRFAPKSAFPVGARVARSTCLPLRAAVFAAGLSLGGSILLGFQPERSVSGPTLGNYPATSITLSTNTTVTPSAAPTNTNRITVLTSASFKGTLDASPVTGVVRATDAHPAGTYSVTVRAFNSSGVSATKMFTLAVTTPPTCVPVSVAAATNFAVGSVPDSVAVADFNCDGIQDLAVINENSSSVSILLGNGAGEFGAATTFAVGTEPLPIAIGDFNGDGNQDLVVGHLGSTNVSILLGDGTGNFSAPTSLAVGSPIYTVAVGDFNRDGTLDLVTGNFNLNNVSIFLGNGDGTFIGPSNFGAGSSPVTVAVGDFNSDGNLDVAVANYNSGVSILLGSGTGTFGAPTNFSVGTNPTFVSVGDLNGDGIQDLAVTNSSSNNVSVLLGNGDGTFNSATNFSVGTLPTCVAVGDFNGDGSQDLAVTNFNNGNASTVSILLNNGIGGLSAPTNFAADNGPHSVAVGDFNGDGKQDLAVANRSSNNVSILLRDCELTPTSIVSRKTHGSAGTFDIDLALAGSPGIECRSGGPNNDYTMVATFVRRVDVTGHPQAQIISGTGSIGSGGVSNGGVVTISSNTVTVPLTNIANAQILQIQLNGVTRFSAPGNVRVRMGVLIDDTNANGKVNSADLSQTKARLGQIPDATNFRSDVNANGTINTSDVLMVKSNIGTGLP